MDKCLVEFWFNELEPKQWFVKDLALDAILGRTLTVEELAFLEGPDSSF